MLLVEEPDAIEREADRSGIICGPGLGKLSGAPAQWKLRYCQGPDGRIHRVLGWEKCAPSPQSDHVATAGDLEDPCRNVLQLLPCHVAFE